MNWNAGGWFGGQLGGTAWIFVAGVLSAIKDFETGMITLALFVIPNIVGLFLWRKRESLSCYKATQLLLALIGICGFVTIYVLDSRQQWLAIQSGSTGSASGGYITLAITIVGLMAMFYIRFGRNEE